MRTIGLLGGMSWESSAEYYRFVNEAVRDRLGGFHSAECVMHSVDFAEIEAMQVRGDWEAAGEKLAGCARSLEAGGAELLILCTNTMHRLAPEIEVAISIPFVHIADPTGEAIKAAGIATVAAPRTRYTMEGAFYVAPAADGSTTSRSSSPTSPTARWSTTSSTRSSFSVRSGRSRGSAIGPRSRDSWRPERRASSSAAPRLGSSSAPTTARCRCSTPRAFTPRRRSSWRWLRHAEPWTFSRSSGPTAVGKTGVAIEVAALLRERGEDPVAVSCDAMQVYRGLEILSGAAGAASSAALEHRLLGIVPLDGEFSAGRFANLAHAEIDELLAEGRRPILVGGTGLYMRAALSELELRPPLPDEIRAQVEGRSTSAGPRRSMGSLTPTSPPTTHPNDRKRIVRLVGLNGPGSSRTELEWPLERRPAPPDDARRARRPTPRTCERGSTRALTR